MRDYFFKKSASYRSFVIFWEFKAHDTTNMYVHSSLRINLFFTNLRVESMCQTALSLSLEHALCLIASIYNSCEFLRILVWTEI